MIVEQTTEQYSEDYDAFLKSIMDVKPSYLNSIYNNSAQNPDIARVLFVCSMGMLRSPTCAAIGVKHGLNTRSCGVEPDALIVLDHKLLKWADIVVFMDGYAYENALFMNLNSTELKSKSIIWNVPDEYDYMDDGLVYVVEHKIKGLLNE